MRAAKCRDKASPGYRFAHPGYACCSEMQGYLFSPPKPAAEIRPLLSADRQGPDAVQPSSARRRKPEARTA